MNPELKPFLTLPFKEQKYKIEEGWRYSEEESSIHGLKGHGGVDFELKWGTSVLAAASGYAISSYFGFPLKDKEGNPKMYQGKPVGFGLGYFVQIYHPETKIYTSYGHLEKIAEGIKFHKPIRKSGKLWPMGNKVPSEKLISHPWVVEVQAGEIIGYVGSSGLTWGYEDYPDIPDHDKFPSWDDTHLHFEVFIRQGSRKLKKNFDPYGIKSNYQDYPDSFKKGKKLGQKNSVLWVLGEDGLPKFHF